MKKTFNLKGTTVALAAALVLGAAPLYAGPLQSQMDQIFNSMVNVSKPGVYETQRRGVLTGGSFYTRNKIVDTQIAAFAPPSWKGGCGGIDFFAGSFSFINADQFVQLLRAVASNAVGYAFEIALDTTCPQCTAIINTLQEKIQKLNQFAGNSCQLAQGLVNDVADGVDYARKSKEFNSAAQLGMTESFMDSVMEIGGKDAASQVARDPETAEKLYGNIVWKELRSNDVAKWFVQTIGTDRPVYEMLMSITGTVIVEKPEETQDNTGGAAGSASKMRFVEPILRLTHLVDGGETELWKCESNDCMKPAKTNETIKSLQQQIYYMLVGSNDTTGIIRKYANPAGGNNLTEQEKALLAILPDSAGALVRNLSANSPGGAHELAYKLSYAIAIQESYALMNDLMNTVSASLGSSKMMEAKDMLDRLAKARLQLNEEFKVLAKKYPTMSQVLRDYYFLNQVVRKADVMYRTSAVAR